MKKKEETIQESVVKEPWGFNLSPPGVLANQSKKNGWPWNNEFQEAIENKDVLKDWVNMKIAKKKKGLSKVKYSILPDGKDNERFKKIKQKMRKQDI